MKDAFLLAASVGAVVSIISFLLFQLFPRQILGLFGSGSEEYFEFGVNYFRAFLFFTWLNFLQPISSMFFSSIGKAYKGTFLSLTRQILFLLPLIVALPHFFGIMGVLYAGPIATFCSFAVGLSMVIVEFNILISWKLNWLNIILYPNTFSSSSTTILRALIRAYFLSTDSKICHGA